MRNSEISPLNREQADAKRYGCRVKLHQFRSKKIWKCNSIYGSVDVNDGNLLQKKHYIMIK